MGFGVREGGSKHPSPPSSQFLFSKNKSGTLVDFCVRYARVLDTLVESATLADRVREITFVFDSVAIAPGKRPDYALLKRLFGFRTLKRAVKRLFETVWRLVRGAHKINFLHGPSWAL